MRNLVTFVLTFAAAAILSPTQAAERKYSVFGFENIRINNGVNVVITTGKGPSARAEAENREILDRLSLERGGNQLRVLLKPKTGDASSFSAGKPVTLYLSTYAVKSISLLGSGTVTLDELSRRSPQVRLGGFGSMTIGNVDSDTINIGMNGGGQLTIGGEVGDARIELLGASVLDGSDLTVEKLLLRHRGPASSHVLVEREADISNSGAGTIRIDGRPNCKVRTDGGAQIVCNPER